MTRYHFTGIKGSGMSSLAQILFDAGEQVQGSDVDTYYFTEQPLRDRGIEILTFDENNMTEGLTVIAGNAFSDDHPELVRARELGLEVIRYHKFLGEYSNRYTSIAITGAHGKTSTTGLMSHVVGGYMPTSFLIGDGTGSGKSDASYFVMEACEYRRHFLAYHPDYAVMTNIDFDHPDYFSDIEDVYSAFQELAHQVNKAIIACGDDEQLQKIQANVPVIYYGFGQENDFAARNIVKTTEGTEFDVYVRNEFYSKFFIPLFGDHTVLNSLAVISLCHYEGVPANLIQERLLTYSGVKRRFTETKIGNAVLVDDYAHHPEELRAFLSSMRKLYPTKKLTVVFQPHLFTRTRDFSDGFAEVLGMADELLLMDIYPARELPIEGVTSLWLLDKVNLDKKRIVSPTDILQFVADENPELIVTVGAGDIDRLVKPIKAILEK